MLKHNYKRMRVGDKVVYVSRKSGRRVKKTTATVPMSEVVKVGSKTGTYYVSRKTGRRVTKTVAHKASRAVYTRAAKTRATRRIYRSSRSY